VEVRRQMIPGVEPELEPGEGDTPDVHSVAHRGIDGFVSRVRDAPHLELPGFQIILRSRRPMVSWETIAGSMRRTTRLLAIPVSTEHARAGRRQASATSIALPCTERPIRSRLGGCSRGTCRARVETAPRARRAGGATELRSA
jgi:hypothetical protein